MDRFRFIVWDEIISQYRKVGTIQLKQDGKPFIINGNMEVEDIDGVIIEQCTGLKDKNGTLIFEGDIVCYDDTLYSSYATKMTGVVVYRKAAFCYKYSDHFGGLYQPLVPCDDFWQRKTEIIGNIHEREVENE